MIDYTLILYSWYCKWGLERKRTCRKALVVPMTIILRAFLRIDKIDESDDTTPHFHDLEDLRTHQMSTPEMKHWWLTSGLNWIIFTDNRTLMTPFERSWTYQANGNFSLASVMWLLSQLSAELSWLTIDCISWLSLEDHKLTKWELWKINETLFASIWSVITKWLYHVVSFQPCLVNGIFHQLDGSKTCVRIKMAIDTNDISTYKERRLQIIL